MYFLCVQSGSFFWKSHILLLLKFFVEPLEVLLLPHSKNMFSDSTTAWLDFSQANVKKHFNVFGASLCRYYIIKMAVLL